MSTLKVWFAGSVLLLLSSQSFAQTTFSCWYNSSGVYTGADGFGGIVGSIRREGQVGYTGSGDYAASYLIYAFNGTPCPGTLPAGATSGMTRYLVKQDHASCTNDDVVASSSNAGGAVTVFQMQSGPAKVVVRLGNGEPSSPAPNTAYHFDQKCVTTLGDITTDESGLGAALFDLSLGPGAPAIFEMYPEGSPEGDTFQSVPMFVFSDVPPDFWAFPYIQSLYNTGVTAGCTRQQYCPANPVTREQMAVFLVRALRGSSYVPPAPTGIFGDVPPGAWSAGWIEQLYSDGITGGCSGAPLLYCPLSFVTRDQMAILLLRARHGAGYAPPAPTGIFDDVPAGHWAEAWIEQLYREGITAGCATSPLRYCPGQIVNRAEIATFLTRAFEL
jgi:hypothetical protein